jgi:transmembrane sensor
VVQDEPVGRVPVRLSMRGRFLRDSGGVTRALWARTLSVGAVVGVVVLAGLGYLARPAHSTAERKYTTGDGQRAVVELADGSRMILAPRTSAVFRLEGSEQARVVTVVGQARFEVNPTATSPFIVRTRGVTARVLGTTFDVRQYPDEVSGTVAVLAGKVVAGSTVRRVILTAGMEGRFADSTVAMRIFTDSADYGDWTHGQLAFRDVPVKTLLTTLQHWYGYRFELKDSSLAAQHVTTVFAANDSPAMIRQLKVLLGVRMTFEDSVVTLRPIRGTGAPSQLQKYKTRYSSPHSTEAGR